jgi:hypothetical protein
MFSLFYIWHGLFLNDFKRIQFPLSWFVVFAAFTYLILGAGIYFLYESRMLKRIRNLFIRTLCCGLIAGLVIFMMATIVNISLTKHLSPQHLLIDCAWQISEQTIGAMLLLLLKVLIREHVVEKI